MRKAGQFGAVPGSIPGKGICSGAFVLSFAAVLAVSAAGLRAQDDCMSIPERAGATGLIFNPDGQQVYFERSRCFMERALRTGDDTLCDGVRERRSLLFDGAYYTAENCRRLIARARAAEVAPKVVPGSGYALDAVTLRLDQDEADVRFDLSRQGVAGLYAVDFRFEYDTGGTKVGGAFNPKAPAIEYVDAFERFAPVHRWTTRIEPGRGAIGYRISGRHFEEALAARRAGVPVTLTANLEILQAESGAIPDPSGDYASALTLKLPASGSVRVVRPE